MSNSTSCRRNPSFGRTSRCFRTWRVSCCIIEAKVQKAHRGFLSRGCINLQDWWTRDSHGRNILPAELLLLNTKATKRSCFWVRGRRIRTKYRIMVVSSIKKSIFLLRDSRRAKQVCCVVLIKIFVTQILLGNFCFLTELLNLHSLC